MLADDVQGDGGYCEELQSEVLDRRLRLAVHK